MTGKAKGSTDAGAAEVQSNMDEITDKGYRGDAVDPTPNEAYTVAGVTGTAATPETDPAAEVAARDATGIGLGKFESAEAEAEANADED